MCDRIGRVSHQNNYIQFFEGSGIENGHLWQQGSCRGNLNLQPPFLLAVPARFPLLLHPWQPLVFTREQI